MLKDETIAIVGAGNMGQSILGGLLRNSDLGASNIRASRRSVAALDELSARYPGVVTTTNNAEAISGADVVLLAIKPQNYDQVVKEIGSLVSSETLVISVLAGIEAETISSSFASRPPVVRAMPNTPVLVDLGATAIAAGHGVNGRHLDMAKSIFGAVGSVEVVPEELMDAVTGLSGSGPAYVYMVIEALTDGGVKQGLPRPTAYRLAAQTVLGAARLVIETGKHPAILRDEVTTPGGTAIAAVADLESHGLRTMLINAVGTATRRSKELSRTTRE